MPGLLRGVIAVPGFPLTFHVHAEIHVHTECWATIFFKRKLDQALRNHGLQQRL